MKKKFFLGILSITLGLGLYVYYDQFVKPEKEAQRLLTEAKIIFERGTEEAINKSISILSKAVAKYPETKAATEAYSFIGQGYEKLGLKRLAFLKYNYILKTNKNIPENIEHDLKANLAKLKIKKNQLNEGLDQLYSLLNTSNDKIFRSRIYGELGHTYLKIKKYKKAKEMFDIALNENATNEEAILGKARALKRMGYANKAYDLYDYFLKYYGDFSHFTKDIKNSYANQLYQSGYESTKKKNYYQAISFFKRFLNKFPNSWKKENSLYWLGECYYGLGKYDKAIRTFDQVFNNNLKHKDEDATIKKGLSFYKLKKYALAVKIFNNYLNKYPKGKHTNFATKWNQISENKIIDQVMEDQLPNFNEEEEEKKRYPLKKNQNRPGKIQKYKSWKEQKQAKLNSSSIIEANDNYIINIQNKKKTVEYENVAEL